MKLTLPIMDRFKYPLTVSVIASLLIGFIPSNVLGVSRAFIYMPMFLLGFYYEDYKARAMEILPVIKSRNFAIMVGVAALLVSVVIALSFPNDIIIRKHAYTYDWLGEMIVRGLILLVSTVNVLVLTRFMTNRKIIMTQWGINSLTVYLLHPYILKTCKLIAKPYLKNHQKMIIVFIFVTSILIVHLLSRDFFTRGLNKVLNGIYRVLCIE